MTESAKEGREPERVAEEGTMWTDEEGEADKETIPAMRASYQQDPAAVEATWETYKYFTSNGHQQYGSG